MKRYGVFAADWMSVDVNSEYETRNLNYEDKYFIEKNYNRFLLPVIT